MPPNGARQETPLGYGWQLADPTGLIERQEIPCGYSCHFADPTDLIERQDTLWPQAQLPVRMELRFNHTFSIIIIIPPDDKNQRITL